VSLTRQTVKIFKADIIYHLFDQYTAYMKKIDDLKKLAEAPRAVFPCVLRIVQVFNKRSPLVIGVDVIEGQLRLNTPVCVVGADV
jgi:translation initiation factor 5B